MTDGALTASAIEATVTVPRAGALEVMARMEAARPSLSAPILASDADGTLWDGDVGNDIFEALLAEKGVRPAAWSALAAEALAVGMDATGDANTLAANLYRAHFDNRFAHDRAFAMMAWAFAGWHRDEVTRFSLRVLASQGIEGRVRPELRAIVRWAADHGVEVFVVSASPVAVVEVALRSLGVLPSHVAAMTPATDQDGVLRPELAGPIVYGEGKLAALEGVRPGARASILGAFGDSAYDAAMLRAARIPVAVTPTPGLLSIAHTIPGLTVLDR